MLTFSLTFKNLKIKRELQFPLNLSFIMPLKPLSGSCRVLLWMTSFLLVAFGQPAWEWWIGLIAAICGFALFWRLLLDLSKKRSRFLTAFIWYASVQAVQLSWMASHPYAYIYGVILFCACLVGAQFGLVALFIQPSLFRSVRYLFAVAAFWVILEWSRLFLLSGLAFNPAGIALTGSIYPLQFASIGGVYLLSFWLICTNLFVLKAWIQGGSKNFLIGGIFVLFPYLFGFLQLSYHTSVKQEENHPFVQAILVQTAFPVEETMGFQTAEEVRQFVMDEWVKILSLVSKHQGKRVDLIILPENVVPYGTYTSIFSVEQVRKIFEEIFGEQGLKALPKVEEPLASYRQTHQGDKWLVSNAFFTQALANLFNASVVIGLEDAFHTPSNTHELCSAAFCFFPHRQNETIRYEKRVLVPMGEYIPFEFCRTLAAQYGIQGSFTPGKSAKIFSGKVPFGLSICYEEMYGDLMRENRVLGAELLVNLTNDGWYPNSRLPKQHFDHSRLRTVENGIPLIRACNTGITGAIDSLGQVIQVLGKGDHSSNFQETAEALYVEVPIYCYQTLYSQWGDSLVIGLSFLAIFGSLVPYERKP